MPQVINDTGGKYYAGVNYTSGKFATGINALAVNLPLVPLVSLVPVVCRRDCPLFCPLRAPPLISAVNHFTVKRIVLKTYSSLCRMADELYTKIILGLKFKKYQITK